MSAYCFFQNIEITDNTKMSAYVTEAMPLTQRFGGQYVVLSGKVAVKEGDWSPSSPVIIKFPTMEAAVRWYESDEYKPLKALRQQAGRFSAVFIDGVHVHELDLS